MEHLFGILICGLMSDSAGNPLVGTLLLKAPGWLLNDVGLVDQHPHSNMSYSNMSSIVVVVVFVFVLVLRVDFLLDFLFSR